MDVAIAMGSTSDYEVMQHAELIFQQLEIKYKTFVVSAHRTPERLFDFAKSAEKNEFKAIIAGASGAAHLPGMIASLTTLPVLGVPVSSPMSGIDSLLSIVQMPGGVPVATFSIGKPGAINAALFAARILSLSNSVIRVSLEDWCKKQTENVPLEV